MIERTLYLKSPDDPYESPRRFLTWIVVVMLIAVLFAYAPILLALALIVISGALIAGLTTEPPAIRHRPYDREIDDVD
jgi:hypothetical protein